MTATPTDRLARRDPRDPVLAWRLHRPDGAPKGAVLLTHGYGEHSGRYDEVVAGWTARGLLVATWDLRGHGHSEGPRGHVAHFSDYVRDAIELLDALDADVAWHAASPPVVFGHSLGGLITAHVALAAPGRMRGVALSSPFFGLALSVPAAKRIAGRLMSRLVPTFGLPTGLKGADLTHDEAIAHAYDVDPLGVKNATARWFTEATAAQAEAFERAPELRLPLLCLHGGADKVASVEASEAFVARASSKDKRHERIAGRYHEILNEPERAGYITAFADAMCAWSAA